MEEFFAEWDQETLVDLDATLREHIYKKYVLKCEVLQRDNFKCQNEDCKTPLSSLTIHHTKFRKNGGEDKAKNCVTICKTCHKTYHRGKIALTYYGLTYSLHKDSKLDWKIIRKKSKIMRKENRESCGIRISWELWKQLMQWLDNSNFYEYQDEEDD